MIDNQIPPPGGGPDPAGIDAGIAAALSGGGPAINKADPYKNKPELLKFYKEAKRECLEGRAAIERLWWRNVLYRLGRQWVYYDRRRGQWVDKRMARWIPRPVTNKVGEVHEALVAMFAGINLEATARPIGGDVANIATAETVDRLEPFLKDDHEMQHVMALHDSWLVLCGNAYLHTYYDKNPQWGIFASTYEGCGACGERQPPTMQPKAAPAAMPGAAPAGGVCRKCGAPTQPQTEELPIGKGRTIALSPFEVAAPLAYQEFEDSPIVLRLMWKSRRQLEAQYGRKFLEAQKIVWQKSPQERSLQLIRALAIATDASSNPGGATGGGGGGEGEGEGTTEFELWAKPTEDYGDGLLMRVLGDGDDVLMIDNEDESLPGPIPFTTKQGSVIIPFMHTGFKTMGGKLYADGPIDAICAKNDQLNRLDSLTELIVQRHANPVWLEPKGAEVKSFTGEPGLVVKYNPLASGGAKPERMEGGNIQGSLFQLRQQILDDIEQLSGTYDALKGAKPAGVEAFSALQLLVERGQARFAPVFSARGATYRKWLGIALELERQFGPTKRTFAAMSPNRGWTMQHFEKAQLQGAIEIIVEDGTQAPKSNLGVRAAIEQAKNLGMVDATDAEQKHAVLSRLGLTFLMPSLDFHIKAALQEQDAFETWAQDRAAVEQFGMGMAEYQAGLQSYIAQTDEATAGGQEGMAPLPEMPEMTPFQAKEYHDGRVHVAEHTKWANSDSARELFSGNPLLEQAFTRHLELHDVLDAVRMMRQQLAQQQAAVRLGMITGAPPGGAGGGGQAMASSNAESGAVDSVPAGNSPGNNGQGRGPE